MTGMSNSTLIIFLVVLILLSGLFSAIETAYSSASRIRLKSMDTPAAESVLEILEHFDRFISTVLIGNNSFHPSLRGRQRCPDFNGCAYHPRASVR